MVNTTRIFTKLPLMIILAFGLTSCGWIQKNWGEKAPDQKQVSLKASALPSFENFLKGSDADALFVLSEWEKMVTDAFGFIQGSKAGVLTLREIDVLIKSGLVDLGPNSSELHTQLKSALRLLGFGSEISAQDARNLFQWVRTNRHRIRTLHRVAIEPSLRGYAESVNVSDLEDLMLLVSSFTERLGNTPVPVSELEPLLQPWIPKDYVHAKKALKPGIDLVVSFFASLCGERVDAQAWNGKRFGDCLTQFVGHFKELSPYLEFVMGTAHPIRDRASLKSVQGQLSVKMTQWIHGHHHPSFEIGRIRHFSEALELPLPPNFNKISNWLPRLSTKNTPKLFHPEFGIELSSIFENWLSYFLSATENQTCTEDNWSQCSYQGSYSTLQAFYQPRYAKVVKNKTWGMVKSVSLYDSLGRFFLEKLDTDKDGFLDDEIRDLLDVLLKIVDSRQYLDNIVSRVLEKPIDDYSIETSIEALKLKGLSELAALAAEVFPDRKLGENRTLKKKLRALFDPSEKQISYSMDALGISSVFFVYDLISSLRNDYLTHYDLPQQQLVSRKGIVPVTQIHRKKIVEALPSMLYDHFPNVFEECVAWGFERTCGTLFTEVLASPIPGTPYLEPSDIDMISVTAIFLEGLQNRCDYNGDGKFKTQLLDGFDEKHCVLKLARALLLRLMNAGIMDSDPKIDLITRFVANSWVGRQLGRNVIGTGSPLKFFLPKAASLGSIINLAADLMDSDKTEAIEKGYIGPHADPGDELIYLNQMTQNFIPAAELSKRLGTRQPLRSDQIEEVVY